MLQHLLLGMRCMMNDIIVLEDFLFMRPRRIKSPFSRKYQDSCGRDLKGSRFNCTQWQRNWPDIVRHVYIILIHCSKTVKKSPFLRKYQDSCGQDLKGSHFNCTQLWQRNWPDIVWHVYITLIHCRCHDPNVPCKHVWSNEQAQCCGSVYYGIELLFVLVWN